MVNCKELSIYLRWRVKIVPVLTSVESISAFRHAGGGQQQLALRIAELAGAYSRVGGHGTGHGDYGLGLLYAGDYVRLAFCRSINAL